MFQELLEKMLEGTITSQEEGLLKQYYDTHLRQEFEKTRDQDESSLIETREKIRSEIHAKIYHEEAKRPIQQLWLKISSVAAVLLLFIMVGHYIITMHSDEKNDLDLLVITTGSASRKIVLPDSSVVIMNKNATISYHKDFKGSERRVNLDGEAYFSIIHNEHKPFIVQNNNLEVKDIGTSFIVSASAKKNYADVCVFSGEVMVQQAKKMLGSLKPNQRLLINRKSGGSSKYNMNLLEENGWIHPEMNFSGNSLKQVFALIEKEYAIHITGAGASLTGKHFSGNFSSGTSLEAIMNTLANIFDFKYKYDNENMTLYIQ